MEVTDYPTISLIVPIFGVEHYIEECLDSIINQTYAKGFECILVDDCSKDQSMNIVHDILDCYNGNIQFRIIVHEKNMGLSEARNSGLAAASGDYVMFVDSDDILAPDCIEMLINPLNKKKYDLVIGDYKVFDGEDTFSHLQFQECELSGNELIADARKKHKWYPMAWGKLIRRDFLKDNGLHFCPGIIHEDVLFSTEMACVINSMYCLPEVCYNYRICDKSIMASLKYERQHESCKIMLDNMYSFLKQRKLSHNSSCNDLLYSLFSFANISVCISSIINKLSVINLCNRTHIVLLYAI